MLIRPTGRAGFADESRRMALALSFNSDKTVAYVVLKVLQDSEVFNGSGEARDPGHDAILLFETSDAPGRTSIMSDKVQQVLHQGWLLPTLVMAFLKVFQGALAALMQRKVGKCTMAASTFPPNVFRWPHASGVTETKLLRFRRQ